MVSIGDLPGEDVRCWTEGMSADGLVIVGVSNFNREAFRWTAADGMVGLGFLPGAKDGHITAAVSADGKVIVGTASVFFNDIDTQAWRWTAATGLQGMGFRPGSIGSTALGVSRDGSVVVGFNRYFGGSFAKSVGEFWLREFAELVK